jgi:hypothetical protein
MLRYSRHARDQMALRGITEAEVEDALTSEGGISYPDELHPDRTVHLKDTVNGVHLKIVVPNNDPRFVITVADRDNEL